MSGQISPITWRYVPGVGALEQFPKGTDLSIHTQQDLDQAAYSLNTRPRQTLSGMTPSDKLAEAMP
jgi:IS30 family transposase